MIKAFNKFWSNYANFKGRTRRRDFWLAYLFNVILMVSAQFAMEIAYRSSSYDISNMIYYAIGLYALAIMIPNLSLMTRRLHDIGKSGGFIFLALIPFVGAILLLVWFSTDSDSGQNIYGENPKNT